MKLNQEKRIIWLFLKIPLSITLSTESFRRDLFIVTVIERFVFKNNKIRSFLLITPS